MPQFYFHIQGCDDLVKDDEGIDLADLAEAKSEAIMAARDILSDAIRAGEEFDHTKAFVIADEQGRHLMSVLLTDAIPKHLRGQTGRRTRTAPWRDGRPLERLIRDTGRGGSC